MNTSKKRNVIYLCISLIFLVFIFLLIGYFSSKTILSIIMIIGLFPASVFLISIINLLSPNEIGRFLIPEEQKLLENCPEEFKKKNKWSKLAIRIINGDLDLHASRKLNFRSKKPGIQTEHIIRLLFLQDAYLNIIVKEALLCWKLSEAFKKPFE